MEFIQSEAKELVKRPWQSLFKEKQKTKEKYSPPRKNGVNSRRRENKKTKINNIKHVTYQREGIEFSPIMHTGTQSALGELTRTFLNIEINVVYKFRDTEYFILKTKPAFTGISTN